MLGLMRLKWRGRYLEIADFGLALLQIVDREHKANEANKAYKTRIS